MARLCAHGDLIGKVELLTSRLAYMSDGKVLRDSGSGWKLYRKVNEGVNPSDAYARRLDHDAKLMHSRPLFSIYRAALHEATRSLDMRARLNMTIDLMPDDPDGVWSECCDGYVNNIHLDISEISELCGLYNGVIACTYWG